MWTDFHNSVTGIFSNKAKIAYGPETGCVACCCLQATCTAIMLGYTSVFLVMDYYLVLVFISL